MHASYERQVEELNLRDHVEFLEPQTEMKRFYDGLDAFAVPSLAAEGLSRCLMEAMTVGLPVVATTAPGSDEVVTGERTGLLVPKGDTEALAAAIARLANDAALRERLGMGAQSVASERLTISRVAEEVHHVYVSLTSGESVPAKERRLSGGCLAAP
jgi:glycosyltransferase involved in cell wall biosynthesis